MLGGFVAVGLGVRPGGRDVRLIAAITVAVLVYAFVQLGSLKLPTG